MVALIDRKKWEYRRGVEWEIVKIVNGDVRSIEWKDSLSGYDLRPNIRRFAILGVFGWRLTLWSDWAKAARVGDSMITHFTHGRDGALLPKNEWEEVPKTYKEELLLYAPRKWAAGAPRCTYVLTDDPPN